MAAQKNSKNPDNDVNGVSNPVQVFCRLRPLKTPAEISNAQIRNLTTVLFPPNTCVLQLKQNVDHETHYVFKHVFDEAATQADIFNVVARPLVERLIRGGNSLLFTYGVTGSGKTFTMSGIENQCGILPRCLKALFQTIAGYRAANNTFQSDHLNGFEIIAESDLRSTVQREAIKTARSVILRRKNSEMEFNLESIGPVLPVSGINEHNIYAVFVTYVEIYNNSVYDLLENGSTQKVLQSHIVREDSNHHMYIHGATEVEINSVQEAIEVYQIGQKRKRMGQTALNAESSRSHSVFNIRLVQAPSKDYATNEDNSITISQLSLVDLAGSERSSRTKNTGARLRETGNINNSLMKLRECLEYLRENQQAVNGSVSKKIPYRDSKLTYLFKNFFEGEGQVSMVVCINPNIKDFAENAQVLKFAEMTQEIQIMNTKPLAVSTPLKRQAWNKENFERNKELDAEPPNHNGRVVTKTNTASAIRKPMHYQKSFSNDFNFELDFNHKKIVFLEKQNLELRLELTKIREAYERLTGQNWCNGMIERSTASIFATVRKPLFARQRTNIRENPQTPLNVRKQNTFIDGSLLQNKAIGTDFQIELKQKLQMQRKKLEESLIEADKQQNSDRALQSMPSDMETAACVEEGKDTCKTENKALETNNKMDFKDEHVQLTALDNPKSNLIFGTNNHEIIAYPNKIEASPTNGIPKLTKIQIDECIQMDVFASFKLVTPKLEQNMELHSTPFDRTPSCVKRKLDFFNDNGTPQSCKSLSLPKDPDFDRREHELSLKMENHRKKQRGNKYLMDILCSIKRSKSSSSIFYKNFPSKKNLFPEEKKPNFFNTERL